MTRAQSPAYLDQVIEAAFLHTKLGCYFVGPFSRRVSFSSQQCRAIDLVNALAKKFKLRRLSEDGKPPLVAVMGGGVAGLTAAAMLRGQECSVQLFESGPQLLHLQSKSHHRVVHPTISRWPGTALSYSTDFGFLDWCAGTGEQVIATLREGWCDLIGPDPLADVNLSALTGAMVDSITGDGRVSLTIPGSLDAGARAATKKVYDLAVISVGFGWPAAGLVDTEIRFSNRIGGFHATTSVQPRVQA